MARDQKPDALNELRKILAAHAQDPRARLFKLDATLRAIDAAVAELERRSGCLAAALLLQIEALPPNQRARIHPGALDSLACMNDHARTIAQRLLSESAHGQ